MHLHRSSCWDIANCYNPNRLGLIERAEDRGVGQDLSTMISQPEIATITVPVPSRTTRRPCSRDKVVERLSRSLVAGGTAWGIFTRLSRNILCLLTPSPGNSVTEPQERTMRTTLTRALLAIAMAVFVSSAVSAQDEAVSKPDSVRKYRFLGKTSRDKNDHQAVVDYYTQLLKYQEPDRRTLYYIGRAYLGLSDQNGAKAAFLQASQVDSSHANTALSLYQIYAGESKPDSAWVFLHRLQVKRPNDPRLLGYERTLGDLHRRQSQPQEALAHYERLADHKAMGKAARAELVELIAVLYSDLGDAKSSLAWRKRMLGGDAGVGQIETLRKMVDLQLETGDFRAAFKSLRKLTVADSSGRYSHFLRMSEIGERHSDDKIRLVGLEGMARVQPDDLENVATLVQFHIQAQDVDAAMRWIDRGLKRSASHAHLLILRGDLLYEAGKEDDAVASFELARIDPNWEAVAQQRIWQIHPPETEEEKLRREFFGNSSTDGGGT
jgi:tetratricopeptide (TPR) repeat protein